MDVIKLSKRDLLGNKAKRLYRDGNNVPAVLFNSKGESTAVQAEKGAIERLLQNSTTSTVVSVDFEGKAAKVLIKDVDIEPTKSVIRHIGFFQIDENAEMTYEIPVELVGVSPAVKNNLGVLVQPTKSLEVRGKLVDLVDIIEVDISALDTPGQTIIVSDIKLPDGLKLPNEEAYSRALASITQLQKVEEVAAAAEEADTADSTASEEAGADASGEGEPSEG